MTSLTPVDLTQKYAASLILNGFLEADMAVPGESHQKQYLREMCKAGIKVHGLWDTKTTVAPLYCWRIE